MVVPKGFFPLQDTGAIQAITQEDIDEEAMAKKLAEYAREHLQEIGRAHV